MNRKGFTLVELIVVITILAILGTIAFLSFQGYTKSSRDTVRINDINLLISALELYKVKTGELPEPTDPGEVAYEGKEVWTQGVIGQSVITNLDKLDKVPRDPLTGSEYTYSRLNTKNEFQIAAALEGSPVANIFPQTYASTVKTAATAYVKGNYNGQIAKVQSGSTTYILAVPTIINGDMTLTDIVNIISSKKLVYNGYANLPSSYTGTIFELNGGFDYSQTGGIVVYSGSINDLKSNESSRIDLAKNLQDFYRGTIVENSGNIKQLVETDIDKDTPNDDAKNLACGTIDLGLGTDLLTSGCISAESNGSGGGANNRYPGCDADDIIIGTFTIAACNVGTNISGTGTDSYGGLFQWGNNYDFRDGQTTDNLLYSGLISSTRVPTSTYGPSNYYYSSTFITTSGGWDDWSTDPRNNNLWGDETDTNIARKGPCADGYHIPTRDERVALHTAGGWGSNGNSMSNALKIPKAGSRSNANARIDYAGQDGSYWTSSPNMVDVGNAHFVGFNAGGISPGDAYVRAYAFSIRCFKN